MTVVTFLSDFGTSDIFVGVCHGVILSRAPEAHVVDLTHEVPPQDVRTGALLLARAVPHIPGAVHLAVVDPGVGTDRAAVAVQTDRGDLLVGPDNGLLTPAADVLGGARRIHQLEPPDGGHVSATFHGRDLFAPAAGALAAGVSIDELGPPRDGLMHLDAPRPVRTGDGLTAEIILEDRFGNLQLSAYPADAREVGLVVGGEVRIEWSGESHETRYVRTFGDLPAGGLGLLVDSDGALAIVVAGGSAAERLGAGPGGIVRLSRFGHDSG